MVSWDVNVPGLLLTVGQFCAGGDQQRGGGRGRGGGGCAKDKEEVKDSGEERTAS